ncbi:polyketide synthase [Methylomagnum sp.]
MTKVVNLSYVREHIAVVELADRASRNTFSPAFVAGVEDAFRDIAANPAAKCVMVHGFDNYFCCGGTQEELLAIFHGRHKFDESSFFRALLDCELPTISAMQGHALGGGLVFGCYGDFILMADRCLYSANFMKYGFTPGMGATHILPKKFGTLLGTEMLFTARNYHGGELRERAIPVRVLPQNEVIGEAMALAEHLIDKPVTSLKLLKRRLAAETRALLPGVIAEELAMHEVSFRLPEVEQRIYSMFGK